MQIPRSIVYNNVDAQSYSNSGFTVNIHNPDKLSCVLDNEIIIKYTLTMTVTNAGARLGLFPFDKGLGERTDFLPALRQCWAMSRAIQSINMNINRTQFTVSSPNEYIDALNRLCISEDESRAICSMSGGAFDSGNCGIYTKNNVAYEQHDVDAVTGSAQAAGFEMRFEPYLNAHEDDLDDAGNYARNILIHNRMDLDNTNNNGLFERQNEMWLNWRLKQADDALQAAQFADAYEFEIYERLFLGPFLFYDSMDKPTYIPHIDNLRLNVQFVSNLVRAVLQCPSIQDINENISLTLSAAPQIQTKWKHLPISSIPKSMVIPCPVYRLYSKSIVPTIPAGSAIIGSNQDVFDFNIHNLERIPTMMFIFCKKRLPLISDNSEPYLSIDKLELRFSMVNGKCNEMSQAQLYKAYLKHTQHKSAYKISFDQWRRYNCCAVLTPSDIGFEPVSQLSDGGRQYTHSPLQLSAKIWTRHFRVEPRMGKATARVDYDAQGDEYNFNIVCCYRDNAMEMFQDGGIKFKPYHKTTFKPLR